MLNRYPGFWVTEQRGRDTMNRIKRTFDTLKEKNRKAFIAFVTAGDPSLEDTYELVLGMEKSGVDIIELGIPFSDPMAEGPVIQRANERALSRGINVDNIFDLVEKLRIKTQIPIIFLLYYNSVLSYGSVRFFKACVKSGVDGLIIPDLPYEEKDELIDISKSSGVNIISLVSPTSKDRIKTICAEAEGFVYCVSSLGVTGTRSEFKTDFRAFLGEVRAVTNTPAAIGFGISNGEQAAELKKYADGIIIGSAIIRKLEENLKGDYMAKVMEFVGSIREALDR